VLRRRGVALEGAEAQILCSSSPDLRNDVSLFDRFGVDSGPVNIFASVGKEPIELFRAFGFRT